MKDVSPKFMWVKFWLLALIGVLSASLLILECPSWRVALLLGASVWAFCRAYYFAFYVISHYIDPEYRFSGLGSFVVYVIRRRRGTLDKHEMGYYTNRGKD